MTAAEINSIINTICSKLELPAQKGFEYISVLGYMELYKACVFTGITVICMLILCIAVIAYIKNKKLYKNEHNKPRNYYTTADTCETVMRTISLLSVFSFTFACVYWYSFMLWYHSPEAWAIRYIIDRI